MSDTRTNAGVDNVQKFRKMFTWFEPGERVLTLLTAGNLATTQTLVSLLNERSKAPSDRQPSILEVPSMFQAATLVGDTLREVVSKQGGESGQGANSSFGATLLLGGQIGADDEPRLFMIYSEGNFLEATDDTPFLQIGETKYGRPILVRAFDPAMSFEDLVKLLFVSFDSTIKANLSVGMPLDLMVYERDSLQIAQRHRIERDSEAFRTISQGWGESLKHAVDQLPDYEFPAGPQAGGGIFTPKR